MSQLSDRYKVQRLYKKPSAASAGGGIDEDALVHSCLLEYGEKASMDDMFMDSGDMQAINAEATAAGRGSNAAGVMDSIKAKAADRANRVAAGGGGAAGPGSAKKKLAGFDKEYAAAQKKASEQAEAVRSGVNMCVPV